MTKYICIECETDEIEFSDSFNVPIYYIGRGDGLFSIGDPSNPFNVDGHFCGPECASKFIRRKKMK